MVGDEDSLIVGSILKFCFGESVLKAFPWFSSVSQSTIPGRNQKEVCGDPLRTSFTIATNRSTDCLVVFLGRNVSGLMSGEDKLHILDMQTHAKHS